MKFVQVQNHVQVGNLDMLIIEIIFKNRNKNSQNSLQNEILHMFKCLRTLSLMMFKEGTNNLLLSFTSVYAGILSRKSVIQNTVLGKHIESL